MSGADPHALAEPSDWIVRWSHLAAPGGRMLDVACGSGRHMQWFARQGLDCLGVDRSAEALASARAHGEVLQADIEASGWPFAPGRFDLVVVTNYLWRPLLAPIISALAPGGLLLYETFAQGNESVGRPSRPDFLLAPGELLAACQSLRILGYEDGFIATPERFVQRIAAVREVVPAPTLPVRWRLP